MFRVAVEMKDFTPPLHKIRKEKKGRSAIRFEKKGRSAGGGLLLDYRLKAGR